MPASASPQLLPHPLTQQITPARFRLALRDLPPDALQTKAAELLNTLHHLQVSNAEMKPFADDGDSDCKEAMDENVGVMARVRERLGSVREEVEGRGMTWGWGDLSDEGGDGANGDGVEHANGVDTPVDVQQANGIEHDATVDHSSVIPTTGSSTSQPRVQSGSLTDAELERRLMERLAGDGGSDVEDGDGAVDDGVHL